MFVRLWIIGALLLLIFPQAVFAQTADFLSAKVTGVHRSLVCSGEGVEQTCHALFLISGKNFVNSNGAQCVKIGDEWANILKWTDTLVVASASQDVLEKTPIITIDTTLHKPTLSTPDETLNQMFVESVDIAIESIKMASDGTRYVVAGPRYTDPERTYYRDSYWTSGMILMIEPYVVRDQIFLLASGIEPNGSTPSAIPIDENDASIPLWLEHHDAGLYFIMMVYDYISWTGDTTILREMVNGRSIFTTMEDVVSFLSTRDTDGNLLPEKNGNPLQDWLDSIPRPGEVFSNQVLYYKALRDLVEISELVDEPTHALAFHRQSILIRYMINKQFWNENKGYYFESCNQGVCEDRLTNESALALLYDIVPSDNRNQFFGSLRRLETKVNSSMSYGDWGVLNAWPLYDGFDPYTYQNGTDWPFLDGINAGARLLHGNDDWYYPLTRWWQYNREHWPDRILPEYVSPIDDDGGEDQAWSVNPMTSFVRYGLGLNPDLFGEYPAKSSPVGVTKVSDVVFRGQRITLETE